MKARDELIRMASDAGWTVTRTRGDHLRLEHPEASTVVFTGSTPSDYRALANTLATMRRVLPKEPPKPKPERPKRRPKPKPAPPRQQVENTVKMYRPPEPELPLGLGGSEPRRRPIPGAPRLATSRWP
jgi:hypothetical protein